MKKVCVLVAIVVLVFVLTAGIISAEGGGEQLYMHKFIKGSDPDKMVLNEDQMLTREQLAYLILELNGIQYVENGGYRYPTFADNHEMSDWATGYIALCDEKGFMKGVGNNRFNPKGLVGGKQLGQVMLRALGYQDVAWADVDKKLAELGIPIKDEALTRGQAFDYIWKVVNLPIMPDGSHLAFKLGKVVPGRKDLPQLEVKDKYKNIYTMRPIRYFERWNTTPIQYFFVDKNNHFVLMNVINNNLADYESNIDTFRINEVKKITKEVFIRIYRKDWKPVKSFMLPYEGDLFGGFYEGKDYYYMVFGKKNTEQDDNKTVLTVVKYDKDFNKLDSLDINNAYTVNPFDAGSLRMAEKDGYLAIHTARLRYDGHQSQLTVVIDTNNMKVLNELGSFQTNHVSHSFDQYVFYDNQDRLILFDHGDAYPRALALQVFEKDGRNFYQSASTENYYPQKKEGENYFEFLRFPGMTGANVTGTCIGDIVEGSRNYIMGTNRMNYDEAVQNNYVFDSYKVVDEKGESPDFRNVYIDFIDKKDFRFTTKQLTFDANKLKTYSEPKIVSLKNERYMVLWMKMVTAEEGENPNFVCELQYVIVDEQGEMISPIKALPHFELQECHPIYTDGKVMWMGIQEGDYDEEDSQINYFARLYTIDVDPAWLK